MTTSVCQREIPPTVWRKVRLGDIGFAYSGLSGKTKEDFGRGSFYVPYKNVFLNTFLDIDHLDLVNIGRDENQNKVEVGDVLLTISSETPEEVGMSTVVDKKPEGDLYLNSFCFGFRPTSRLFETAYAGYAFRSELMRKRLVFLAQGSTRYNISKSSVLDIEIPIPTRPEQKKIAQILIAVDDKLDVIARQITATRALKQGLMQTLFTKGVGTQDADGHWVPHTDFRQLDDRLRPSTWQLVQFGSVAPIIRREVDVQPEGSYPELGLRSFGKGTFHKPALTGEQVGGKRLFVIKAGDFLLSNVFAWEGSVAVARPEDDGRFGSHRYITCAVNAEKANAHFIARYLLTPPGLAALGLASPGGAGRNKTLGLSALAAIKLPLPPLVEQIAINDLIAGVESKIEVLQTKHAHYQTLKRGLMQKLLTGEWRVKLDDTNT